MKPVYHRLTRIPHMFSNKPRFIVDLLFAALCLWNKWFEVLKVSSSAIELAMGAQQGKERGVTSGASIRNNRSKPRVPKDPRILGSNIFTEHSGMSSNFLISNSQYILIRRYHVTFGFLHFYVIFFNWCCFHITLFWGQSSWKLISGYVLLMYFQN